MLRYAPLFQFCLLLFGSNGIGQPKILVSQSSANPLRSTTVSVPDSALWRNYSAELKSYAGRKGYNTNLGIIINMSIASGKNRFFLIDLKKDSLVLCGLVTHGSCNQEWLEGRKYGNEVGCGCTSLGHYKIGDSYLGKFGLAFKLTGLDSSNSNAFNRFVVLHSHPCVPAAEIDPAPLCQSLGCPTVSPAFLSRLETILKNTHKPLIMLILDKN